MKEIFRKYQYHIITTITVVLLLAFGYQVMAFLVGLREEPERRPPQVPPRAVKAREVSYSSITSPVTADGRVISSREVLLGAEVRGLILAGDVSFKKGAAFRKDDVLIRIFDDNAVLDLRSRKSAFLQKIAGILPDMEVDYPDSHDGWLRFFRAIDIEKPLPDLPAIGSDQEKIFVASRNILTDYYAIKSAEITLEKYVITAPFDGSFTEIVMEVGAIANPGATLARIIQTDDLEVEVPVEQDEARWVAVGDDVELMPEDGTVRWRGTVVRKADFVDPSTQSISVFVSVVPGRGGALFKGQYLRALFPGRPIDGVMEIPRNAVFNHNQVFVVVDDALEKREITIIKINETTLLFSGLEEGVDLVVEPLVNAMENTRVEMVR